MIYLQLFLTFLEIGAFSFGGGYGMISIVREKVLSHGWLTEDEILNIIAVSESTPGPIAINMATFVGSTQGGVLGSILATFGVVLPAFCIILMISAILRNFLKYKGVQAFLGGVRPAVVGLILATSINMFLTSIVGLTGLNTPISFDPKGLIIFGILVVIGYFGKKILKKKPSPILMILISAVLGMVMYGLL